MIPGFKPNLCIEPKGAVTFPKLVSMKLDGIRCVTLGGEVLSRSLKPIPNAHIREMLAPWEGLDGELIVGEANAPDVYRTTNSAVMSRDGQPKFTYYVFDDLKSIGQGFSSRLEALRQRELPSFIRVLDQRLVAFQAELDAMYGSALEDGFEGLIARNLGGLYKFGRSTAASQDALKLKPFADSDAVVLSVFEAMANQNEAFTDELGRTKRSTHAAGLVGKGTLGGFICRDVASGVEFSCAPGLLSHAEREALWAIGGCVGRILKYRHLPVGVKDLPRHPRFIGWRSSIDM